MIESRRASIMPQRNCTELKMEGNWKYGLPAICQVALHLNISHIIVCIFTTQKKDLCNILNQISFTLHTVLDEWSLYYRPLFLSHVHSRTFSLFLSLPLPCHGYAQLRCLLANRITKFTDAAVFEL